MSQTLVEKIPQARLAVLKHASHLSAMERPQSFAQAVTQFILALRRR
ncbi:alpha/beta fold hydrolase [Undibacterium arcticum]|uniref:Alpha/beta fold hydrolase n=1 Tax=Undibacterium arcticum TaxID=1762892 RepID=A0ABV7F878_9BURK